MQFVYKRDGEEYVYAVDGETRFRAEEIAIAYTEHDSDEPVLATLHKHGPADAVQDWYREKRPVFDRIGFRLKLISSSEWDADDLDRFINCTGYLGVWLKRQGIYEGAAVANHHEQLLQPSGAGAGCDRSGDQEGVPGDGTEVPPGS